MCDYCHSYPHLSGCPNSDNAEKEYCYKCDRELEHGELVYVLGGKMYCDDCVSKSMKYF